VAICEGKPSVGGIWLYPVEKEGKWGYIDIQGRVVVECVYNDPGMVPWSPDDYAVMVDTNDRAIAINRSGRELASVLDRTKGYVFFYDSLRKVKVIRESTEIDIEDSVKSDDDIAINNVKQVSMLINVEQDRVLGEYESLGEMSEGLILAKLGGKYGYIDRNGKRVISFKFKRALGFHEGLAAAEGANSKWGFIGHHGDWVIQPKFDKVLGFSCGVSQVIDKGKCVYVDTQGELLFTHVTNLKLWGVFKGCSLNML